MKYHDQIDIRAELKDWKFSKWRNKLMDNTRLYLTPIQVKGFFLDCVKHSKNYIPTGEYACKGFTVKDGCPGHDESIDLE